VNRSNLFRDQVERAQPNIVVNTELLVGQKAARTKCGEYVLLNVGVTVREPRSRLLGKGGKLRHAFDDKARMKI
jgi:hypothetical protein